MFGVSLKEIPVPESVRESTGYTLREMSAGTYSVLHEHLLGHPNKDFETVSPVRYQGMIVLLCLWKDRLPVFLTLAKEVLAGKVKTLESVPPAVCPLQYAVRSVTPEQFFLIVDAFTGQLDRNTLGSLFDACESEFRIIPEDDSKKNE